MKAKILLFGALGQLGWQLQRSLAPLGEVIALSRSDCELTSPLEVIQKIREHRPTVIVNAAAYTAVGKAEEERALAMLLNGQIPGVMAEEAKRLNAWLLHYSSDYVFDGSATTPYDEMQKPRPVNAYGESKLSGENAIAEVAGSHLIVRTSWVYGDRGTNFLKTMLRLAQQNDELRIVADQIGAPTWSRLIAEVSAQMLLSVRQQKEPTKYSGVYHLTAAGQTSWEGFARTIFAMREQLAGIKAPTIHAITSAEYMTAAKRPHYSVLSNSKLYQQFDIALPTWEVGLRLCLQDLQ